MWSRILEIFISENTIHDIGKIKNRYLRRTLRVKHTSLEREEKISTENHKKQKSYEPMQ